MAKEDGLACVGSVCSRVTELVREQEKWKTKGGRGGGKRNRLPANPAILENAP